ncbi:MAG: hypothetical protein IJ565_00405 [Bacilli bacterium]|nr:hypothetical protein [Bacilli bacterium]
MNDKEFIKKIKKEEKEHKKKTNKKWIVFVTILSLVISILFSLLCEILMPSANTIVGIIVMFLFIGIGIVFDILGVSVTSADIKPYHSMAAKKIKGAKVAVKLKQNTSKVSSVFCDVIGDICGIVSGSAGVYIASKLAISLNINPLISSLLITGIISSITIGGKAIGKGYAINNSTMILYDFSKFLSVFYKIK